MTSRVALVTGANRGLGLEVAKELGRRAMKVVLGSRERGKGEAAAKDLRDAGLDSATVELDVASPDSMRAACRDVLARFGHVDVLVNNAGISVDSQLSGGNSIFDARIEALQATLATNLYGPLVLSQELASAMRERRYGRIVNVSSAMGRLSDMDGHWPAYRISKAALNALTRILSSELRGTNVLVNSVCPGWVRTEMGGPSAPRSLEQGAAGIVWAATLPDGGPSGGFFRDGKAVEW